EALVPHGLDRHIVMDERVALRVARDTYVGQTVIRGQRGEQGERIAKLTRRLARVARDHEHVGDAGRLQRIEDLSKLHLVPDETRREMWDRLITELRERDREMDRRGHAPTWRGGDRDG